jgi:DNA-binding Lrp family transcriptional regulator
MNTQLENVQTLMLDGQWRTLSEIANSVKASTASVSARLRDLRKKQFGGYNVIRLRKDDSTRQYLYKVIPMGQAS